MRKERIWRARSFCGKPRPVQERGSWSSSPHSNIQSFAAALSGRCKCSSEPRLLWQLWRLAQAFKHGAQRSYLSIWASLHTIILAGACSAVRIYSLLEGPPLSLLSLLLIKSQDPLNLLLRNSSLQRRLKDVTKKRKMIGQDTTIPYVYLYTTKRI